MKHELMAKVPFGAKDSGSATETVQLAVHFVPTVGVMITEVMAR